MVTLKTICLYFLNTFVEKESKRDVIQSRKEKSLVNKPSGNAAMNVPRKVNSVPDAD